jgi:hypothetical protein
LFLSPFSWLFLVPVSGGSQKALTPGYRLIAPAGACFSLPETLKMKKLEGRSPALSGILKYKRLPK